MEMLRIATSDSRIRITSSSHELGPPASRQPGRRSTVSLSSPGNRRWPSFLPAATAEESGMLDATHCISITLVILMLRHGLWSIIGAPLNPLTIVCSSKGPIQVDMNQAHSWSPATSKTRWVCAEYPSSISDSSEMLRKSRTSVHYERHDIRHSFTFGSYPPNEINVRRPRKLKHTLKPMISQRSGSRRATESFPSRGCRNRRSLTLYRVFRHVHMQAESLEAGASIAIRSLHSLEV